MGSWYENLAENRIHTNSYQNGSWYELLMESSNKVKNGYNSYQPKQKNQFF